MASVRNNNTGTTYPLAGPDGPTDLQDAIDAASDGDVLEILTSQTFDAITIEDLENLRIQVTQGAGITPTIYQVGVGFSVRFYSDYYPSPTPPVPPNYHSYSRNNVIDGFDGDDRVLTIQTDNTSPVGVVLFDGFQTTDCQVVGAKVVNTAAGTCVMGLDSGFGNSVHYSELIGVAGATTAFDGNSGSPVDLLGCQIHDHQYGAFKPRTVRTSEFYNCDTAIHKANNDTFVRGCTIDACQIGIHGEDPADTPTVINTVITNCTTAAYDNCLNSLFHNMRFFGNASGEFDDTYFNRICSEDPYLDATTHDYSPKSGIGDTGLFDTGQDQSRFYTTDINQTTRPQHSGFDIGAIELIDIQPVPEKWYTQVDCNIESTAETLLPLMQDVEIKVQAASVAADAVVAGYAEIDDTLSDWPGLQHQIEEAAESCWPKSDDCSDILRSQYQIVQYNGKAFKIAGTNLLTLRLFYELYGMKELTKFINTSIGSLRVAIYREQVNFKDCPEAPDTYSRSLIATDTNVNIVRAQNMTIPDSEFKVTAFWVDKTLANSGNNVNLKKYQLEDARASLILETSYTPDNELYTANSVVLSLADYTDISFYLDDTAAHAHLLSDPYVNGIDTELTNSEVLAYLSDLAQGSSAGDEEFPSLGGVSSTSDILYCTNIAAMALDTLPEKLSACGAEIPMLDISDGIKEALNSILSFIGGFTSYLETMQTMTQKVAGAAKFLEGAEKKILQALGLGDINSSILQCLFKEGVHLGLPKQVVDLIIPTLPALTVSLNKMVGTIDTFLVALEQPICVMTSFTDLFVGRNMGLLKCFNISFDFEMPECLVELLELMRTALGAFSSTTFAVFSRIQFSLALATTLMSGIDINFQGSTGCYNDTLAAFQKALGKTLSGLTAAYPV